MRAFRTIRHLRRSKVLVGVARAEARSAVADAYAKRYGTNFKYVGGRELQVAFDSADPKQARKETEVFTRAALRVVEPRPEEIYSGLRFYLGLRNMMREEGANAFTIDCFGTLRANTLPGYPCIAWSKLNDAGLYGVCEADLHSTMTQLLLTSYTGVPGFVSDPVFDASRNEVIHAHCVSATRMKGPAGPASPYIIRNHLETNEGAVLQVMLPAGETITVARFAEPGHMLVSTAEVIGPGDNQRGCRTQIRTRVADANRWLRNYGSGLHRVIFYGDHVRTVEMLGRMLAYRVTQEV
jgi:L-fucose isomerase-like protein